MNIYSNIKYIGFDADDTLWENEHFFRKAEQAFYNLVEPLADRDAAKQVLFKTETEHIQDYGYGIVPFILSMIETALQLSDNRLPQEQINHIIEIGQQLLNHPVELLDGAEDVLKHYAKSDHKLFLITKGTLQDQERKIELSGLKRYFDNIEIVSHKTEATYRKILDRYNVPANQFVMIGNSLKSDILPVLNIGANAIYIPHKQTWAFEQVSDYEAQKYHFKTLTHLKEIREVLF